MQLKWRSTLGLTVIELMIALTLSALLLTALIGIFVSNLNYFNRVINTNRLNQQLQAALQIMTNDIRRAGFWANARNDVGIGQNNNPFMTSTTDVSVSGNSCILFTYDHGKTGSMPAISASSDDDRYGFQLVNQAIQSRPPGATFACGANDWEDLTDKGTVLITALTFTLNTITMTTGPGAQGVQMRSVDISVTGQSASDSSITNTLTQHVRIQNDKFIP